MNGEIKIDDLVVCINPQYFGVRGRVIKQYYPTACEEQTMIRCTDGREFHAPTRDFAKVR